MKAGFCGAATAATAAAVELVLDGSIVTDVTDAVLDGSFAHFEAAEVAVVADAATGAPVEAVVEAVEAAAAVEGSFFSAVSRSDALKAVAKWFCKQGWRQVIWSCLYQFGNSSLIVFMILMFAIIYIALE